MKSNICKIENGTKDLAEILSESDKVAAYNGLSHKQASQLRLLCEEIDGLLPNIIDRFEGSLWIEAEAGVYEIHVSVEIPTLNVEKKEELVGIAKDKRNAAAVGIVGRIRNAIENFFLDEDVTWALLTPSEGGGLTTGYKDYIDYTHLWSLDQYRNSVKKDEQTEAWDELEKSVIASVADDVIVGVKGCRADIIIVKNFA